MRGRRSERPFLAADSQSLNCSLRGYKPHTNLTFMHSQPASVGFGKGTPSVRGSGGESGQSTLKRRVMREDSAPRLGPQLDFNDIRAPDSRDCKSSGHVCLN